VSLFSTGTAQAGHSRSTIGSIRLEARTIVQLFEPNHVADASPSTFKFFAFLSYSREDEKFAKQFHRDLEQYRIPKALVGAQGRDGPIPKRLFPIFRDREELSSAPDISHVIRAALDESACLVVLCSPAAARSRWVNEEVLAFRCLGRQDRIFAVILRGEPYAKESMEECFPPALHTVDEGGTLLADQVSGPLAADMRPRGDGKEESKLKIVAGLLNIPLNDLRRREVIAARRRARIFQGIAAVMLVLAASAIAGGWIAYRNMQRADRRFALAMNTASGVVDRAVAMSEKQGVPADAIGDLLNWADQSFAVLSKEELPDELVYQRANVLMVFSDNYALTNRTADQLRVAQEARDMLTRLTKAHPDVDNWQQRLSMAYDRIGQAYIAEGNPSDALAAYREALVDDERLLARKPADPNRRRAMALSYERLGTVLSLQGKIEEALAAQEKSFSLSQKLAEERKSDITAQTDLAVSYEKLGELLGLLGRDRDAIARHRSALFIRNSLAQNNPGNTRLMRDLEVSYNKVGQLLLEMNDVNGALDAHTEALNIAKVLASSDPRNAEWQHDLGATRLWRGDALDRENLGAQAMDEYTEAYGIVDRLVADNPRQAVYRFALSGVLERLGDMQLRSRHADKALALFTEKRHYATELVREDPTSGEWQRDLLIAHVKVGDALEAEGGDATDIQDSYSKALAIARQMSAAGQLDPSDAWMLKNLERRVTR
jgi:tetratricopeptide (TPR) repeat protein